MPWNPDPGSTFRENYPADKPNSFRTLSARGQTWQTTIGPIGQSRVRAWVRAGLLTERQLAGGMNSYTLTAKGRKALA